MVEEYGSLSYIFKKNYAYLFADKKRVLLALVYSVYLFLFGRRLMHIFRYFTGLLSYYFKKLLLLPAKLLFGSTNKIYLNKTLE